MLLVTETNTYTIWGILHRNVNTTRLGLLDSLGGWLPQKVLTQRLDGIGFLCHIKGFRLYLKNNEKTSKNFESSHRTGDLRARLLSLKDVSEQAAR